ncbi:MAG: hypothetical protein V3V08_14100 [Nannocystaceae bacterium]
MDSHPRYGVAELLREAAQAIEEHPATTREVARILELVTEAMRATTEVAAQKSFGRALTMLYGLRLGGAAVAARALS